MASSSRLPHLLNIIKSLPTTPLRPAGSPQLSNALESIANRISTSPSSSSSSTTPDRIEGMIGVLERLKANTARDEFTLTDRTLRPAHDPQYYKRMKDGVHRASQGQGRSWWKTFFQLKGDA